MGIFKKTGRHLDQKNLGTAGVGDGMMSDEEMKKRYKDFMSEPGDANKILKENMAMMDEIGSKLSKTARVSDTQTRVVSELAQRIQNENSGSAGTQTSSDEERMLQVFARIIVVKKGVDKVNSTRFILNNELAVGCNLERVAELCAEIEQSPDIKAAQKKFKILSAMGEIP